MVEENESESGIEQVLDLRLGVSCFVLGLFFSHSLRHFTRYIQNMDWDMVFVMTVLLNE